MDLQITTAGALIGLIIAIVLIVRRYEPAYGMMVGALIGGLVGGASLIETVNVMIGGAQDIMSAVVRIIASGVLAGTLIKSGAAIKIAEKIIDLMGEKRALLGIMLSTMILTGIGVFGDVAVITVAPIAIALGNKLNYSKITLLAAMVGGEKAGMVISPNPNTIATAENFGVELFSLMMAGFIPAIFGILFTILVCKFLHKKFPIIGNQQENDEVILELPSILASISGPIVVIALLVLRPVFGITVDPLVALPIGGLVGMVCMRRSKQAREYMSFGLQKMMPVAILLIGTGTIAGIIKHSALQYDLVYLLDLMNLPEFLLAPISGTLMGAVTASSSAGAAIASSTFGATISTVIAPLYGAVMLHAGTIVLDTLPQGSFFHASAGAVNMSVADRLKLLPYDFVIGAGITVAATILYGIIL
ncbi:GntP family permease [Candidatus Epulonipiscium viviparus]|uniref:GntP family permease n=1 Tax=Candidatus Epulonipiscium viviparus TaxID=420336 RepID=UPI0027381584|nr:GntP family permease [Candidatus Epulopiscium viviparus]